MRKVKCRTPDGVEKELIVYCLVYNPVHATMLAAARRQHVEAGGPDQLHRRAAVAADRRGGRGLAGPDRQPEPPRPPRAPGDQGPAGHLPENDPTEEKATASPEAPECWKQDR